MPKSDREEIEQILQRGEEILSNRPELADMELDDVLNALDDGTSEMIRDRWGVVAKIVYKSITDFSLDALVQKLAQYKDIGFICEYVGYLILTERCIEPEELLLEADRQEVFSKIVPYVNPNIQYEDTLSLKLFGDVCTILNSYIDTKEYHALISAYVEYIENHHIHHAVVNLFDDIAGQSQYDIMRRMGWSWYQYAYQEASNATEKLLSYNSIWSKKAGLYFLKISLRYGETNFLKEYDKVENMIQFNQELWLSAIPLFIQALSSDDHSENGHEAFAKILSKLDRIPEGSLEERRQFISTIQWKDTIHESVDSIFQRILHISFEKDNDILQMLDRQFYLRLNKHLDSVDLILEKLFIVFSANHYGIDRDKFLGTLHSVRHKLADARAETTKIALTYFLIGGESQFFFGLGLLTNAGNILTLNQGKESLPGVNTIYLTETQMIRIMNGILYFSFDEKCVCRTAFHLLLLAKKIGETYYQFCVDEIFANYPGTMCDISKQFKSSENERFALLAEKVENASQEAEKMYAIGRNIQDIFPSYEHLRVYQNA